MYLDISNKFIIICDLIFLLSPLILFIILYSYNIVSFLIVFPLLNNVGYCEF